MGRKRREPSPPPPPPPEDESSSEESSSAEEEEEEEEAAEATPATQNSPKPPPAATAGDGGSDVDADPLDGSDEESSESGKIDAEAFELRQIASSRSPPAAAPRLESDAGEPSTPGKAKKKGKAGAEKAAPEPSPSGKAKKAKAKDGAAEKAPSELTPSSEGKKKHRHEKRGQLRRWTAEDELKILEALVWHVKANGTQPGAGELIAAVGDSLERKNCAKTEMYEKVRNFRLRYEKTVSTGVLPEKEDELRKFKLSEQVWGDNAKQVAAATMGQNEAASLKSKKKGQTSKEKTEGYSKGGTAKEATASADEAEGYSKGGTAKQATEEKVDEDSKGRPSKKASTADTPAKSRKRGNHKEELEGDPKTDTQNGGTSMRSKSGKSDKEKADGDAESPTPKEDMADTQNGGTLALFKKEGETHEEKMGTDANVRGTQKGFDELQKLYPNLTSFVEDIQAQHPCGETMKRAFQFIPDEKACALESKIKKQRVSELRMEVRRADTKKEVTNIFIGFLG